MLDNEELQAIKTRGTQHCLYPTDISVILAHIDEQTVQIDHLRRALEVLAREYSHIFANPQPIETIIKEALIATAEGAPND